MWADLRHSGHHGLTCLSARENRVFSQLVKVCLVLAQNGRAWLSCKCIGGEHKREETMQKMQKQMMGHALLVIIIALLSGFMLADGLLGGQAFYYYGTAEGWARAHTGGITNGLLVLGVALTMPHIGLSERMTRYTGWGLIFTAWANTAFYWFGNAAGNRALTAGDNLHGAANLLSMIGFWLAMIGVVLALWLLGHAAVKLLRAD
jgi:hypothetical protein